MIPQMPNPDELLEEIEQQQADEIDLGTGFLFDFKNNQFVIQNGRRVELNDIEAVKMWMTKILLTEKYQYGIYANYPDAPEFEYGTLTEFCIGRVITDDMRMQLQENIEASATRHPRVAFLSEWRFEKDEDRLTVYFRVNLVDEQSFDMEVPLYGNG
ncbi:DUF2634 domain-containing protein [Aneurinibacillus migulanus]|uniref:DUF2634 domain-containing protein n=1 Tax=Aneurinibacillus migulanus TaxID=47500 RepID=A0A1G8PL01_ANEMI|nr:DUF2634 domain-containing protein [Aneurinibacillus migulanus]KIV57496.1 hypothetical protein TS65_09720 [Aneurinibacillus migulanus]MED0892838.1 DUF2634 domain-containing protein [Aneurinibacillus migulanus]MED1619084.1 DUF2634 domain-containing protein [Aneurinibacillus migulanus]SDI92968.1 Protein of unknown function [Aneurinibacillus migulanus]GED13973.1 hypothetical protein AMI01nite_19640 [Aneurinibacillus migulanus]